MAFQGAGFDIIIDAVLTEVGKKRMAEGNFRIAKFSLGDDEIDYNRFDLESDEEEGFTQSLLTQPCMEAGSTNGANILYGLQTFKRQDLLHFPVLKVNKASQIDTNPTLTPGLMSDAIHTTASAYYLSANEETSQKIDQIFSTGSFKYLTSDDFTKNKIIIVNKVKSINKSACSLLFIIMLWADLSFNDIIISLSIIFNIFSIKVSFCCFTKIKLDNFIAS